MSRVQKLHRRLRLLEKEFALRLREEFLSRYSMFLLRKYSSFWTKPPLEETASLERLERQIIALRTKLNEPLAKSPVSVVREFAARAKTLGTPYRRDSRKPLEKEMLAKLDDLLAGYENS